MSELRNIIIETANKIFKDLSTKEVILEAEKGKWPQSLWQALEDAGMTLIGVPEEAGGSGGEMADALQVLKVAGRFAAPIPLAETLIANWILADTGLAVSAGPLTFLSGLNSQVSFKESRSGWVVSGLAKHVPWGRDAQAILVYGDSDHGPMVGLLSPSECVIHQGTNMAGEPRDEVIWNDVELTKESMAHAGPNVNSMTIHFAGAISRAALMAGALEKILELSVSYANERTQFGRPIGRFQAIQQQLAVLAGEVTACGIAADTAIDSFKFGRESGEIMMAKIRLSEAVGKSAPIAHQVHGAIGFTDEHPLHQSTRRLWSWREEFGTENDWARQLSEMVFQIKPEDVWEFISGPKGLANNRV